MTLLVSVGDVSFDGKHRFVKTSFKETGDGRVQMGLHTFQKVALVSIKLKSIKIVLSSSFIKFFLSGKYSFIIVIYCVLSYTELTIVR
jgi:hypothetical protein